MTGLEVLGLLGGLVRGRTTSSSKEASATDFDALLEQAKRGEVRGSRPVDVEPSSGLSLSAAQLDRLGVAADRLESEGIDRALVFIDEMAIRLDVLTRRVTGEVDLENGVLTDIEGVLALDGSGVSGHGRTESAQSIGLPTDGAMNASLQRVLSRLS